MFYDTSNNPIASHSITARPGSSYSMVVRCKCRTGLSLKSESVSSIVVEGRRVGDSTWIDLESSSIDLSPWNNTQQDFEIRLTMSSGTSVIRKLFKIYTV